MSRKVLKLEVPQTYDFELAGVICGFKNYRFCYELNRQLGLSLKRCTDVDMPTGIPGSNTLHATYECAIEDERKCFLISNKDKGFTGYLIPELKNIDFFLVREGSGKDDRFEHYINSVRSMDIVTGVFRLNPEELKSADAFFLILES